MPSPSDLVPAFTISLPNGNDWDVDLTGPLQSLIAAVVIVIVAAFVIRVAHVFVRSAVRALLSQAEAEGMGDGLGAAEVARRQETVESLGVAVVRVFVFIIAGLMLLEATFGLDIGPAIAGLGIAGIAVGLGTQSLVRDYLNGVLILVENQYARGDVVKIAGIAGVVEDFTLRRTTLRDLSGTVHTIPNGEISIASNLTRTWSRINENVQVAYGTDVEKVREVIDGIGLAMAADPAFADQIIEAPHVERINELGDRGITLLVLGKVRAATQWSTAGELRRRMLLGFEANGIEMPTGVLLTWSGQQLGSGPGSVAGEGATGGHESGGAGSTATSGRRSGRRR
jgi:small-conductance mechanosensitive channel